MNDKVERYTSQLRWFCPKQDAQSLILNGSIKTLQQACFTKSGEIVWIDIPIFKD